MTRYSVQPKDQKLVKGHGFLFFAKNMGKNVSKNISKKLSGKYSQKILDHAKQSRTDAIKTSAKTVIKKQQKQLVIWLVMKLLIESQNFQKFYNKIIQKKLQMITKCPDKVMYLQEKDKQLLMNQDLNGIIMEYQKTSIVSKGSQ